MSPLHEYEVDYNGSPTTALLTEEDAARLRARRVVVVAADVLAEPTAVKAKRPINKARTPQNKGA